MSDRGGPEGSWSADLLVCLFLTILTVAGLLMDPPVTVLRAGFALLLVVFLPGYALVSLLFPRWDSRDTGSVLEQRRLGLLERVLLGVLASVAITPGVAYVLAFSPPGLTFRPLLGGVAGITVVLLVLAFVRRLSVPGDERYRIPIGGVRVEGYLSSYHRTGAKDRPFEARSSGDVMLNLLLVGSLAILLLVGAWALVTPVAEDPYTEVTLLAEDAEGDLVAEGHPGPGEGSVVLALDNEEGETVDYTVVVVVQDVAAGDGTVEEQWEIDRLERSVEDGDRETLEYEADPEAVQGGTHLAFLVYTDDVPATPTKENAHRWVDLNVTE